MGWFKAVLDPVQFLLIQKRLYFGSNFWRHHRHLGSSSYQQVDFSLGHGAPSDDEGGRIAQLQKDWQGIHEQSLLRGSALWRQDSIPRAIFR